MEVASLEAFAVQSREGSATLGACKPALRMADLSLELIRGIQIVNDAISQAFVALLENSAFLSDGIIDLGAALVGIEFSEKSDTLRGQARLFQK